jgi:hypothetical protein
LSEDQQRDHGKELEDWRGKHFSSEYLARIHPFSSVPELLRRVRDAGRLIAMLPRPRRMKSKSISRLRALPTLSTYRHHPMTSRSQSPPRISLKWCSRS